MSYSRRSRDLSASDVIDRFERTIGALLHSKLPMSKSKIHATARIALSHSHLHWHFVQRLESLVHECAPAYKLPTLYIIDSIVRHSRRHYDTDVFATDLEVILPGIIRHLFTTCLKEDRPRVVKILKLWLRKKAFKKELLEPLLEMDQSRQLGPRSPSPHLSSPSSMGSDDSPMKESTSDKKIIAKIARSWNLLQSCEARLNSAHADLEDLLGKRGNLKISEGKSSNRNASPITEERLASPSPVRVASPPVAKRVASPLPMECKPKRLCTSMVIQQPAVQVMPPTEGRQAHMPQARVDHTTVCSTSVFVGRIGFLWPDQSVEAITYNLRILFEEFGFGTVLGVDPIPGKYAFVHLSERSDAIRAIKKLPQMATLVGSPLIFDWGWVRALRHRKPELQNYWDPEQGVIYMPHSILTLEDMQWLNSEDTWVDVDTIPGHLKSQMRQTPEKSAMAMSNGNALQRPSMVAKVMYSRTGQPILGLNLPTVMVPLGPTWPSAPNNHQP